MQSTYVDMFKSLIYKFFPTLPLGGVCSVLRFLSRDLGHNLCSGAITQRGSYSMAEKRHQHVFHQRHGKRKDQLDFSGLS